MGNNSANVRDLAKNLAPNGVFKVVHFNGAIEIYHRPTLVAMVAKTGDFFTRLAITHLTSQI